MFSVEKVKMFITSEILKTVDFCELFSLRPISVHSPILEQHSVSKSKVVIILNFILKNLDYQQVISCHK